MSYKPIENYGIIGDLHTVALVGMDGSIDFMSFPDFDSPTIFAALLDESKGGRFSWRPSCKCQAETALSTGFEHFAHAIPIRCRGRKIRISCQWSKRVLTSWCAAPKPCGARFISGWFASPASTTRGPSTTSKKETEKFSF